jgi:hypothetical protein
MVLLSTAFSQDSTTALAEKRRLAEMRIPVLVGVGSGAHREVGASDHRVRKDTRKPEPGGSGSQEYKIIEDWLSLAY